MQLLLFTFTMLRASEFNNIVLATKKKIMETKIGGRRKDHLKHNEKIFKADIPSNKRNLSKRKENLSKPQKGSRI